jgi:hypothetical protein
MRALIRNLAFGLVLATSANAQETLVAADAITQNSAPEQLPEVLVIGEQPGPGLWKISKTIDDKEHVLWIVGAYTPLPTKMTWHSKEIEAILAESQRLVTWARFDTDFDAGFFSTVSALPLLFSADRNVDGAALQDVLPADVYAHWLELKAKYLKEDDRVEKLRPTFAWSRLSSAAFAQSGLSSEPLVTPTVERLAKKHKVKIVRPKEVVLEIKIDKPRALLKKFKTTQLADVDCFGPSLDRLEPRIESLKVKANAWAVGDVEKLRAAPVESFKDCEALFNDMLLSGDLANKVGAGAAMEVVKQRLKVAATEALAAWFEAIDDAIRANPSTMAVVPTDSLFGPAGVLESLRQRGYTVDEP